MFLLEIKDSAVDANRAVADLVEANGVTREFTERDAAERLASDLSERGGRVRVQGAAPQDPSPVNGYLVPFPKRFHDRPKESDSHGLTYDVDANLYGELGRALIHGTYGVSPAVRYHFYHEVDGIQRGIHRIERTAEPSLPDDVPASVSWSPDCRFRIHPEATTAPAGTYFAEIKTGNASFQRGQLADMREVAKRYGVLKIRVDISDLPDEYTVDIDRLE